MSSDRNSDDFMFDLCKGMMIVLFLPYWLIECPLLWIFTQKTIPLHRNWKHKDFHHLLMAYVSWWLIVYGTLAYLE